MPMNGISSITAVFHLYAAVNRGWRVRLSLLCWSHVQTENPTRKGGGGPRPAIQMQSQRCTITALNRTTLLSLTEQHADRAPSPSPGTPLCRRTIRIFAEPIGSILLVNRLVHRLMHRYNSFVESNGATIYMKVNIHSRKPIDASLTL